jgi:hypothetical protein
VIGVKREYSDFDIVHYRATNYNVPSRKTRCSGKWPCFHCSQIQLECKFTATYRRGRLPAIMAETEEALRTPSNQPPHGSISPASSDRIEEQASDLLLPISNIEEPQGLDLPPVASVLVNNDAINNAISAAQSSRNSPEPSQSDRQGHYVGPASGVSFLLRIQRRLARQQSSVAPSASIFTFGDLPLPGSDVSFFVIPAKSEATALLARYFDFASATHRFFHRPTIESWLQEFYETNGDMRQETEARSRTAVLFMVFAHASSYTFSSGAASISHRFVDHFYFTQRPTLI